MDTMDIDSKGFAHALEREVKALKASTSASDMEAYSQVSRILSVTAQNDMKWRDAISGPDQDKVRAAYEKERLSLLTSILTLVPENDPNYVEKRKKSITGR